MNKFEIKQGTILTLDQEERLVVDEKEIIVKPVWKWLLEN